MQQSLRVKRRKAMEACKVGGVTFFDIWDSLPRELIETLSAFHLSQIIELCLVQRVSAFHEGKKYGEEKAKESWSSEKIQNQNEDVNRKNGNGIIS